MALTADRSTPQIGDGKPSKLGYPVLADAVIYQGSLVVLDSDGYLKPGVSATGLVCVGKATKAVDATGYSSGELYCEVQEGAFKWDTNGSAIAATDVGSLCYVYNDHTVTLTSTSRSIAGTIVPDGNGGFGVYSGLAAPVDGSAISAVASDLSDHETTGVHLGIPVTFEAVLSSATTGAVVARFTPGVAGTIRALTSSVSVAATTASKAATFTASISGVATTGGAVALTSANCTPLGAKVDGSTLTAGGGFTSSQEITVVASSVTAFAEGRVIFYMFFDPA
jgi:hypothetical protein